MRFGEIFGKTWKDYKNNFKSIFIFMLIFMGLFSLLNIFISYVWISLDETIRQVILNPHLTDTEYFSLPLSYLTTVLILSIMGGLLYLFVNASITAVSIKKSKFKFGDIVKFGSSSYLKYISLSLVSLIFLSGLFLLLIIPAIIFGIYWIFGIYVLLDEKKGILESLKRSREIVRGRWWKVFGYFILIVLILMGISSIFSIIQLPTEIIYKIKVANNDPISLGFFITSSLLSWISDFLYMLISIPFLILFLKNFYFDLKKTSSSQSLQPRSLT